MEKHAPAPCFPWTILCSYHNPAHQAHYVCKLLIRLSLLVIGLTIRYRPVDGLLGGLLRGLVNRLLSGLLRRLGSRLQGRLLRRLRDRLSRRLLHCLLRRSERGLLCGSECRPGNRSGGGSGNGLLSGLGRGLLRAELCWHHHQNHFAEPSRLKTGILRA